MSRLGGIELLVQRRGLVLGPGRYRLGARYSQWRSWRGFDGDESEDESGVRVGMRMEDKRGGGLSSERPLPHATSGEGGGNCFR